VGERSLRKQHYEQHNEITGACVVIPRCGTSSMVLCSRISECCTDRSVCCVCSHHFSDTVSDGPTTTPIA